MRRLTGNCLPGEFALTMLYRRLKAIEDILGDDYDLERLKQLLTGDTFTEEDMSAAYTSGYSTGMEQGMEKIERNNKAYDLQPVVRCKDCVRRHTDPHCQGRSMDWYCPKGVRRRTDD